MLFGTGEYKSVGKMTDEELEDMVKMLHSIRAASVTQAKQSIKRRAESRATPKVKKTVSVDAIAARLSPELQVELIRRLSGSN
jgi:hypothetical protein